MLRLNYLRTRNKAYISNMNKKYLKENFHADYVIYLY
jgi:hypothetical protein